MTAPVVDASEKLRLVLDYVPCEVCLSQPSHDQEILCSICARVHRQVGIRVTRRTSVIVERPEPAAAEPVVIPPAPDQPAQAEPAPEPMPTPPAAPEKTPVEVVYHDGKRKPRRETTAIEVVVEAWQPPAPFVAPAAVAAAPASALEAPVDDEWEDVASFEPADDAPFEFTDRTSRVDYREPAEPVVALREDPPAEEPAQDDFVFRPPTRDEPLEAREPEPEPAWAPPTEEVPVEREDGAPSPWARPEETDFLRDEAPPVEPEPPAEPEPIEVTIAEDDIVETEIVESTIVEEEPATPPVEEEVLEMEVIEDEPAPVEAPAEEPPVPPAPSEPVAEASSDLFRLRGFAQAHYQLMVANRIESLAHLAGHDANDLARRTGIPAEVLVPWLQAANLIHEVGVPIDAAIAMVAAGVPGPRGLAEMDEQTIVDRVSAFGGAQLSARDVKRWKRRV